MSRNATRKHFAMVRIIAGQWRGRTLPVLDCDGLRPTKNSVRETLFNWLAPVLAGARCLDLFAGTGAMGFECGSRMAKQCVVVEKNSQVAQQLRHNKLILGDSANVMNVVNQCALDYIATTPLHMFDVIFVDPTFASIDINSVLTALFARSLHADVLIYIEQSTDRGLPELESGWCYLKQKRSGNVVYGVITQA